MRDLTPKEEKEILEFWKANPDKNSSDVVKIFGQRFGIKIAESRIIRIAIDDHMHNSGMYSKESAAFIASTLDEMSKV